ncbi:hypothetical protein [Occallatibacter savannae]|uniref:hypothetical protein n=1 Tax=Occallatibacter savannae TaxID=1002691 RepID=UPI0013A590E0|nr:hypothetical protein [Occallatibacter savannae]
MAEEAGRFSRRSDENLLQLWRARDLLKDEDIDPLRDELEARGLSKQVAEISELASVRDLYGALPTAPFTYFNSSVPALWIRELWLRYKTKDGSSLNARIEKVQRTGFGSLGGAARAEIKYFYEFQGHQYVGRVLRDFKVDAASADKLVYDHHVGEEIQIRVSREAPELSYYPSGMGFLDPISLGLQSLLSGALVFGFAWLLLRSITHAI